MNDKKNVVTNRLLLSTALVVKKDPSYPIFSPSIEKKIIPFLKRATPDWLLPMLLFAMH